MRPNSDNKKRVCVITSSFPRSSSDYAGVFIYELLEELCKQGYLFEVVTPRSNGSGFTEGEQNLGGNIRVNRIGYFFLRRWEKLCYGDGILNNFQRHILAKIQLVFYISSAFVYSALALRRCNIIWSHWGLPSGLVGAVLRRFSGKKHILSLHSGWSFLLKKGAIGRQIARFIINNSDRITAVSNGIREEALNIYSGALRRKLSERIFLLPMGISVKDFFESSKIPRSYCREKYHINSEKTVLFIGRLTASKGAGYLIESLKDVSNLTLMIAGCGSQERILRDMAEAAKCDIRFFGAVSGNKKLELFRLADIVVIPSLGNEDGESEGLPVVMLEAMASSIPIVSTGLGGIKEVIKDSFNGLIAERRLAGSLKDKILLLLNDPSLYRMISQNALAESSRFDIERLGRQIDVVIRN
ncbi:MAG: glycosyltransferase family 4 protein [Candidatus Omnitrophota bacterium]